YHALGVRYLTLTHSENVDWADSSTDKPVHKGLTEFGKDVVREMNRLGMLVDISHVSADTMRHVLRVTRAPLIASHSSAYSIAPQARNVRDDLLRQLAGSGGVVMVNFYSVFIAPEGARVMKDFFAVARRFQAQYPNPKEFRVAFDQWKREHPIPSG